MNKYKDIEKFKNLNSVCLIAHINPDVDALCALSAMHEFLTAFLKVKKVDVFAECDKLPDKYLPLITAFKLNPTPKKYEGAIILDTPNLERMGKFKGIYSQANLKCVIDHHNTNIIKADVNITEITSSCCEIIHSIMSAFNYKPTKATKAKIYAGIITDTNNFTVGAINNNTFKVAGECCDSVNTEQMVNYFFNVHTYSNMKALATAINNINLTNGTILTHITKQQSKQFKFNEDDYIGISNQLANIEGVKLMCFIRPFNNNYYVSLRARRGYSVAELAKRNGGGGHTGASGFVANKPLKQIEKEVINYFNKCLNN